METDTNIHKASQIGEFLIRIENIDINALHAYEALMSVFDFTATYLVTLAALN